LKFISNSLITGNSPQSHREQRDIREFSPPCSNRGNGTYPISAAKQDFTGPELKVQAKVEKGEKIGKNKKLPTAVGTAIFDL
jgi:hypothetical protein